MENKKENIRITKCYLVEYIDNDGKALSSDFCFGSKQEAIKLCDRLKKDYQKTSLR